MKEDKNEQISLERILQVYSDLIPGEFEFLVLCNLYFNHSSSELQYSDIRQAIVDTSALPFLGIGREPQVERVFKGLLRSFLERVPTKFNQFTLTPHAEKVIEIAIHRINNPYLKFPLKETFEQYFSPQTIGSDVESLKIWFKLGFQNNARQIVIGHLDGLRISVDDAIKELNTVLETDHLSAIQMLEQFSKNFQNLGDKARQIAEAIKMKTEVHYRLRTIIEAIPSERLIDSVDSADKSKWYDNRQTIIHIRDEVFNFFEKVDKQLDLINIKMAFASTKITELQESLRIQANYKINLKKLLIFLLKNSKTDRTLQIALPNRWPAAGLVAEKFRFRSLRYYDMGFLRKAKPAEFESDASYEEYQRASFERELLKQAKIQEYCERLRSDLSSYGKIDLDNRLFQIIHEEDGLELGIQAGYEFLRTLPSGSDIEIEEKLQSDKTDTIHIWKTVVTINPDSRS